MYNEYIAVSSSLDFNGSVINNAVAAFLYELGGPA